MSDPASELRALVADLRAAVQAEIAAGRTHDSAASTPASGALAAAPAAPSAAGVAAAARVGSAAAEGPPVAAAPGPAPDPAPAPPEPPPILAGPPEPLDAIRADLGDCRRCGLCEARTHLVFGVGDPGARLMVIGEAPGFHEDQRGEPFVGPAGEMLDRMLLNVLGLPREAVYIANVVKCRPPDNRNPQPTEIATCLPFLRRQVRSVAPSLLLVLGSVAHRGLFGTAEGITRARGQWRSFDGIPAMSTFHPAYLLRTPEHKRLTFDDLRALRARYEAVVGPVDASESRSSPPRSSDQA